MNEPPILPEDPRAAATPERVENPYAPTSAGPARQLRQSLDLPLGYWLVLLSAVLGSLVFSYIAPGLGIPSLVALLSAAIRVPLLQQRMPISSSINRPSPLVMLLTSWGFSLVIGAASVFAFCVVCIPAGLLAFTMNGEGIAVPIVFGVSGIIALIVYVFLFGLSLRMSL